MSETVIQWLGKTIGWSQRLIALGIFVCAALIVYGVLVFFGCGSITALLIAIAWLAINAAFTFSWKKLLLNDAENYNINETEKEKNQ